MVTKTAGIFVVGDIWLAWSHFSPHRLEMIYHISLACGEAVLCGSRVIHFRWSKRLLVSISSTHSFMATFFPYDDAQNAAAYSSPADSPRVRARAMGRHQHPCWPLAALLRTVLTCSAAVPATNKGASARSDPTRTWHAPPAPPQRVGVVTPRATLTTLRQAAVWVGTLCTHRERTWRASALLLLGTFPSRRSGLGRSADRSLLPARHSPCAWWACTNTQDDAMSEACGVVQCEAWERTATNQSPPILC